MAKVQIKSEKLTPFGGFFQSWSNLTPCFHPLSTRHRVGDAAVSSDTNSAKLNVVESYDVDFDHQFLETEKYDAKPTYKKFLGYRPGVYVIGDKIVYVENSDGNTNRFRIRHLSLRLESAYYLKPHCGVRGWCTRIRQISGFCYHD